MSAEGLAFVDTNILVYAHDRDAGDKHLAAVSLIQGLWNSGTGLLSTQVLQEFYVTTTRKIRTPLARADARAVLEDFLAWPVQTIDPSAVIAASELEEREQLSFWDALVIEAARRAGASRLLSEDLQSGRTIAGLLIENPFL